MPITPDKNIQEKIKNHMDYCSKHPEIVQGYAVGIVGPSRVGYLSFRGLKVTYKELNIFVGTEDEANTWLVTLRKHNKMIWEHASLIPVRGDVKEVENMLPTKNGY